jgi:hypothetical protein
LHVATIPFQSVVPSCRRAVHAVENFSVLEVEDVP